MRCPEPRGVFVALFAAGCGAGGLAANFGGLFVGELAGSKHFHPHPINGWLVLNSFTPAWFGLAAALSTAVTERSWRRCLLACVLGGGFILIASYAWALLHEAAAAIRPAFHAALAITSAGCALGFAVLFLVERRWKYLDSWPWAIAYTVVVAMVFGIGWALIEPDRVTAVAFDYRPDDILFPWIALTKIGLMVLFLAPPMAALGAAVRLDRRFAPKLLEPPAPAARTPEEIP